MFDFYFSVFFLQTVYSQGSIADYGKDLTEEAKKSADNAEKETKGFFSNLGDKIGSFYDSAVEKSKEAAKATGDTIKSGYDKLKEKAQDLKDSLSSEKKPE